MRTRRFMWPASILSVLGMVCGSLVEAQETKKSENIFSDTPLVRGADLRFSARSLYKENYNDGDSLPAEVRKPNFSSLSQSLVFDYKSGYWYDVIGFGLSYDSLIKLHASTPDSGPTAGFTDGTLPTDLSNISRFGQRYVALKWGDDKSKDPYIKSQIGWQRVNNLGVIHARDSRGLQKSYRGARVDAGWGSWTMSVASMNAQLDRNQESWETAKSEFYTYGYSSSSAKRQRIGRLDTLQVKWEPSRNNYILYFGGVATDYLFRQGLEGSWFHKMDEKKNVRLEGFLYHNRGLSLWDDERRLYGTPGNTRASRGFDGNAFHYAFRATGNIDNYILQGGMTYTRAPIDTPNNAGAKGRPPMGFFTIDMTQNSVGRFASPSYNGFTDYLYDKELMFFASAGYRVQPETAVHAVVYYGSGMKYKDQSLSHSDAGFLLTHKFTSVKGLSFIGGHMWSQAWKTRDTYLLPLVNANGSIDRANSRGAMLRLDYQYNF